MFSFPSEITGYIAEYADIETLKNLSLASHSLKSEASRYLWYTAPLESPHPERFFIMQRYAWAIRDVQLRFTCDYQVSGSEDFDMCERMLSILFSLPRLHSLHLFVYVPSSEHRDECQIFKYFLEADFSRSHLRNLALTGELFRRGRRDLVTKLLSQLSNLETLDFSGIHLERNARFISGMLPRLSRLTATTIEDLSVAVGCSLKHLDLSCGRLDLEHIDMLISFLNTSLQSITFLRIHTSGTLETMHQILKRLAIFPGLRRFYIQFFILRHAFLSSQYAAPILSSIEFSKTNGGFRRLSELALVGPPFEREAGEQFIRGCFGILGETLNSVEIRQRREGDEALEKTILVRRASSRTLTISTSLDMD
ncbi:hypothetical protein DL93DRAFT_2084685 [Clavulina sp. PMI_390]|nr:hypothetical protein DL93DRAFT_2084685 [Clavulina sp. PMI_390]